MDAETASVKYVFLDVVDFTKDRSVESQSDIIINMNKIVREAISHYSIPPEQIIILPTGDGLCIALIEIGDFDIHLLLGLDILERLHTYNQECNDEKRRFSLRIGINANVDNLITDFNGQRSVAGAGINMAQRIMDKADGNQILIGETVYAILRHREKYINGFQAFTAKGKHGHIFNVYQYIKPEHVGLNIEKPSIFIPRQSAPLRLSPKVAYYLGHAILNREFFLSKVNIPTFEYAGIILLYFLAWDSEAASKATAFKPPYVRTKYPGAGTIEEQFEYYRQSDFWVMTELSDDIVDKYLNKFYYCFEGSDYDRNYIFPNDKGQSKLKNDWPDIWKEFFG
jgi:hypothetical protein